MKSTVVQDEFTAYASKAFDYDFDGTVSFDPLPMPDVPPVFNIGVIHGSSGSGKSTLLAEFGTAQRQEWAHDKAIISHFATPEEAVERLSSVGLNSIPSWLKPYEVLSTGEKFRADLAMAIKDYAVIDEYTSVINRACAKSTSKSISKYIKRNDIKNVVFATCHDDILEWLCPDWSFNTDTGELSVRGWLRQPTIRVKIYKCHWSVWEMFKHHHYLSADINKCSTCYIGVWDDRPVCFSASVPLPGRIPPLYEGDERGKYRESRLVVLPDYQGMGIGTRFSNAVAQMFLDSGYRYFCKTAHIRMGEYREKSDLWRPTSTNLKSREKSQCKSRKEAWHHYTLDTKRLCWSHEYIGERGNEHREKYEMEKMK